MYVAEINVFGPGDKPKKEPVWEDCGQCDLMLITAHPDDELLWFGGLLPVYAGERGLAVQVVCLVPTTPQRRLELLDGLWHCGVTAYPAFGGLKDARAKTLKEQYAVWGRDTVWKKTTEMIRKYKPSVLVTHDLDGEYGHGAHQAAADGAVHGAEMAANEKRFPESFRKYGAWQVAKVYVHLYSKNKIKLDWDQPLGAFGGLTGLQVAAQALDLHKSQVAAGWSMRRAENYDNKVFGLYATLVGEDEAGNDLMEHIPAGRRIGGYTVMDEE